MDSLDAVEVVLRDAAEPLHYREIAERVIARKLWSTDGKTPPATINSRLAVDIQQRGPDSRFYRTDRGVFALRDIPPSSKSGGSYLAAVVATKVAPQGPKLGMRDIRALARQIVRGQMQERHVVRLGADSELLGMLIEQPCERCCVAASRRIEQLTLDRQRFDVRLERAPAREAVGLCQRELRLRQ